MVNMAEGRKNNRISLETRKRIMDTFYEGGDWRNVAELNGVKSNTAYKWLHADSIAYEPKPRGGFKKKN